MKAYVLTKGNYSSYHILGVTLDPVVAYKLQEIFSAIVEEYDIDSFDDRKSRQLWRVSFVEEPCFIGEHKGDVEECTMVDDDTFAECIRSGEYCTHVYVFAPDRDNAVKAAAERRAEYIAREVGI